MKTYLLHLLLMSQFLGAGFAQHRETPAPAVAFAAQSSSAETVWADLMAGNQRFVNGKTETVDLVGLRQGLVKGQSPKVVVLLALTAGFRLKFCSTRT